MTNIKEEIIVKDIMSSVLITLPLGLGNHIPMSSDEAFELGTLLINTSLKAKEYKDTEVVEDPLYTFDDILTNYKPSLEVYTDGACSGNPGPGAAAYLIKAGDTVITQNVEVFEKITTNIRMEIKAAINALIYIIANDYENSKITLYSDSKYVVDGITTWINNWRENGWRKSNKKLVVNLKYWKEFDALNSQLDVDYKWVKGHAGDPYNELVDKLAQNACPMNQKTIDRGITGPIMPVG